MVPKRLSYQRQPDRNDLCQSNASFMTPAFSLPATLSTSTTIHTYMSM